MEEVLWLDDLKMAWLLSASCTDRRGSTGVSNLMGFSATAFIYFSCCNLLTPVAEAPLAVEDVFARTLYPEQDDF